MFVICCHPPAGFPNGFGPYETRKAAREALETAGFTMYQNHQGGYFAEDECEDTIEIVEISPSEKLSQYYGLSSPRMKFRKKPVVIEAVKGEFYPCKPDIFEATYEPAE